MPVYDPEQTKEDKDQKSLADLERSFKEAPAKTSGSDIAKQRKAEQDELEHLYNSPSYGNTDGAKSDETAADGNTDSPESEGSFYTGSINKNANPSTDKDDSDESLYTAAPNKAKRWINKKRAAIAGGIVGGLTLGGTLFFFTTSGPLQFIHFAQMLRGPHFANSDNMSNTRFAKMVRYWRGNGTVGDTRLGWIEGKYKDRIIADMKRAGFEPIFEADSDYYKGIKIDRTSEGSPYKGMSDEDLKAHLQEKFGVKATVAQIADGKFYVKSETFFGQRKALTQISKEMGKKGVTASIRRRTLSKFGVVSWHPMTKIDKKVNQKISDLYATWKQSRDARVKEGVKAATIDGTNAQQQAVDGEGKPIGDPQNVNGQVETVTRDKATTMLDNIKNSKSLNVAGGIAAAVGIICGAKDIYDRMGEIYYAQTAMPLMRLGMDQVTTGSQVQAGAARGKMGDSFTALNLELASKPLEGTDPKTGKKSSWAAAKSIRQNNGQEGGVDVGAEDRAVLTGQKPWFLAWTQNATVAGLCSGFGQAVTGAVSIIVGVFSGGIASTVAGIVAGALAGPVIMDKIAQFLSGDTVDLEAVGTKFGQQADWGVFLASNLSALQVGGREMTKAETAQAQQVFLAQKQAEFTSQPLAYRLFNPYDHQTLASRVIDSQSPDVGSTVANATKGVTHFGSAFRAIPRLFTPKVNAAAVTYDYGRPKIGYSQTEIDSALVENPFKNAEEVGVILDSDRGPDLIEKANECFGVAITKGEEGWQVISQNDAYETMVSGNQNEDCARLNQESGVAAASKPLTTTVNGGYVAPATAEATEWLKLRFFIADTGFAESYACLQGDEKSCENSGFGNGANANNPDGVNEDTGTIGSIPAGTTVQLAQQIVNSPNISFQTPQGRQDFQQIVNTGAQTGCGGVQINPRLLGTVLALSTKYKLVLGVVVNGHRCNNGQHPKGNAIDINGVNPLDGGPQTGNSVEFNSGEMPTLKRFYVDAGKLLSDGGGGGLGQKGCFSGGNPLLPNNVQFFTDTCNHIHMDVR
jgi:hypothetical protein